MNPLTGKVAVVTGSTRGFGYAVAAELIRAGAAVIVSGRSQSSVDQAVASIGLPGQALGLACDVSVPEQVYALGRFAVRQLGTIDIWINNAGYTPPAGGVIDFPPDEALATFKTNCLGVLNGTQTAFYYMLPRRTGTLVNIYGRGSDLRPSAASGLYAATKAWVAEFTRTLAQEHKGSGVQFVAFSPGMMLTDMLDIKLVVGERVQATMRQMPMVLKALGVPPAVPAAELVKLLAADRKEFVEYRWMRGLRAMRMIGQLVWMQMNPRSRPAPVEYPLAKAFVPPIGE
ncbi:MAG TPA: SDR family NAD(P)-dependent oxidoreductase [Anaerolineales bacterium]